MIDQTCPMDRPAIEKSLLQGVQYEAGMGGTVGSPADDEPSVGSNDESDVDKPAQVAT